MTESRGTLDDDDANALREVLASQRESAIASARRECRHAGTRKVIARVEMLCGALAVLAERRAGGVEGRLRAMLRERAGALLDQDPRGCEVADLHKARIRQKRLRYCAEVWNEACPAAMGGLLDTLAGLQRVLGHWNDQITACKIISQIARRRRTLCERPRSSARMLEYAALRVRLAIEDQERVCQEWLSLAAAVTATVDEANTKDEHDVELV